MSNIIDALEKAEIDALLIGWGQRLRHAERLVNTVNDCDLRVWLLKDYPAGDFPSEPLERITLLLPIRDRFAKLRGGLSGLALTKIEAAICRELVREEERHTTNYENAQTLIHEDQNKER